MFFSFLHPISFPGLANTSGILKDSPKKTWSAKPKTLAKILSPKISAHELQKDHVPRGEDVPKAEGSDIKDTSSVEPALPVTPQHVPLHSLETDDARIFPAITDDGRESPPVMTLGPNTR